MEIGYISAPSAPCEFEQEHRRSLRRLVKRILQEPLVHFLLIGSLVFIIYGARNNSSQPGSKRIDLTQDDLRQLQMGFAAQWERQPTPEELAGLVENRVHEEILYREALAMALDKDDDIVKRRMAQKMQFLAEDVANAHEPTTAELHAWFEGNRGKFLLPGAITFRHLYFSPDRRGQRAHEDALKVLAKIAGQPGESKAAASLADAFMFQDYYGDRSPEQLVKEFGSQFAQTVFTLKPGSWQGPIESGYGWHLVFVDSFSSSRLPSFDEVEPAVKSAWLADKHEDAKHKAYETMRAKYTVSLPSSPKKQTAQAILPASPEHEIPSSSAKGLQ